MDEALDTPDLPAAVQAEQTHLRIPSRPNWVVPTVEFLRHRAVLCGVCPESESHRLLVALHEALTNAILHGNLEVPSALKEQGGSAFAEAVAARVADPRYAGRMVEIQVQYDGDHCRWVLTDEGPGFDVRAVLGQRAPAVGGPAASGRGILLMRAFLDEVEYAAGGRQVHLTLNQVPGGRKRREPPRPLNEPELAAALAALHARFGDRPAPAERRAQPRYPYSGPVEVLGTPQARSAQGFARNLSRDGISFLTARPLALGERVLDLPQAPGVPPLRVRIHVLRCTPITEGFYEIGARILGPA